MKRKIFILLMAILCLVGMTKAQTITLEPQGDGNFGKGCLIPVDVYVDTEGNGIFTAGLYFQSDLKFVDFVLNTGVFKHITPLEYDNDVLYFMAFVSAGSDSFNGQGKIGTLYYMADEYQDSHSINFLYDGTFNKSSLNLGNGNNVLKGGTWSLVRISEDLESCVEEENVHIEGGYGDQSYDEAMDKLLIEIEAEGKQLKNKYILEQVKKYSMIGVPALIIIILLCVFLLNNKKSKGKNY